MAISGAEILRDLNISSKCSVEAIKNTKSRLSLIVWVNVVMNRTVVVDTDWRFDNLCGRHVQSQSELMVLYYGYWSDWSITSRCYRVVCQLAVITSQLNLKEQYPVTAHAPNFEFWTGCREIKRCEESKRILKNPFASRLAGFNTTLKLLRIIDQWYIVPVKFRFGQNLDFLGVTFIAVDRRTKRLEAL